jgi:hypothetical protein
MSMTIERLILSKEENVLISLQPVPGPSFSNLPQV